MAEPLADCIVLFAGLWAVLTASLLIAGVRAWRPLAVAGVVCGVAGCSLFVAVRSHGVGRLLGILLLLGLAVAVCLRLLGLKPWRYAAWAEAALLVATGFFLFVVTQGGALIIPLVALYVIALVTAPRGWLVVLAAALWPGVARRRRLVLAAIGLAWAPFGLHSIAHRTWIFPADVGPPPGFRAVERVNYGEVSNVGLFWRTPDFKRALYRSPDASTPKKLLLDRLEERLARAGWETVHRIEGKDAILRAADPKGDLRKECPDDSEILERFCQRWRFKLDARLRAILGDADLSCLVARREADWAVFFVHDGPDGRTLDAALSHFFGD